MAVLSSMEIIHRKKRIYERCFKRIFDIVASLIAIVLLSWLILILWILVRIKIGSPAIFRQKRPGLNGKIITMYKFRSMTNAVDSNGNLLSDAERLTNFGKKLRASSLDELPELFNILKGDLSFVGPRPLLVEYLPLYSTEQARRHNVRPGLTGLAQINGRNAISWSQKFEYDIKYIDNITFLNDIRILCKTFQKAFISKEGINSNQNTTMEDFDGTN